MDVSGQEGSQRVAVIRPVELCLIKPINQHYQPGLLHVQLPLWRERKNNSSTDGGLVNQAARDRNGSDLCRERPVVLVFLSGGLSSDPGCMSADWACSVALESGAAAPGRPPAEGRCLAWLPCCGRTPEPDRCDSYRLGRSDKKLPVLTESH